MKDLSRRLTDQAVHQVMRLERDHRTGGAFENSRHFVDPAYQRDALQRVLGWFETYLPASK